MFELNENQKKEEFNDRLRKFQIDLKALSENYSLMLQPTLHITNGGIVPVLSINDTKYATNSSKESSIIISEEQFAKNKESLENGKKTLERNTKK